MDIIACDMRSFSIQLSVVLFSWPSLPTKMRILTLPLLPHADHCVFTDLTGSHHSSVRPLPQLSLFPDEVTSPLQSTTTSASALAAILSTPLNTQLPAHAALSTPAPDTPTASQPAPAAAMTPLTAGPVTDLTPVTAVTAAAGVGDEGGMQDEDDDQECGVCLENTATIQIKPCAHTICGPCAKKFIQMGISKAPHCPFCRAVISDFSRNPKAPLSAFAARGSRS